MASSGECALHSCIFGLFVFLFSNSSHFLLKDEEAHRATSTLAVHHDNTTRHSRKVAAVAFECTFFFLFVSLLTPYRRGPSLIPGRRLIAQVDSAYRENEAFSLSLSLFLYLPAPYIRSPELNLSCG